MKEYSLESNALQFVGSEQKSVPQVVPKKGILFRFMKHPLLRPYNRLALLVVTVNIVFFFHIFKLIPLPAQSILNFILFNFGIGIFIRQQQVINALFKIATSAPTSWPLSIRWALAKVYHYGGIHVGGFVSGTIWYFYFIINGILNPYKDLALPSKVMFFLITHLVVLVIIIVVSFPKFREKNHNTFEIVARFGNWISLILFWFLVINVQIANQAAPTLSEQIIKAPHIWILLYLTFCVLRPWFSLKKIPVEVVTPSKHVAISHFDFGRTPFAGSSTELSLNPILEWHSFANIPTPKKSGFRLCISRAGDWTGNYIDTKPKHIWVKGIPTAGVGNIELLFKKVIWIATGSGVGPCIPHLLDKKVPAKLIWSVRSPRETYGDKLVNEILTALPNTMIWDTTELGRPNLVSLAIKAYQDFDAEAVIVISNKQLTFHINYELESRGIPSFGAIWDS